MIQQKTKKLDENISSDSLSHINDSNTSKDLIIGDSSKSSPFSQTVFGKRRKNQSSRSSSRKEKTL